MRWTTCANVDASAWVSAVKHSQSWITWGGGGGRAQNLNKPRELSQQRESSSQSSRAGVKRQETMRKRHNDSQMAATRSPLALDLYMTLDKLAWDAWRAMWIWENKLGWPSNWRHSGLRTSLSSTLLLCPSDPLSRAATGWLQLTERWWETAVWRPHPPQPPPLRCQHHRVTW